MAQLTSNTISKPVKYLIRQTQLIASGKKETPLEIAKPATKEFELLSKALVKMTEKLEVRSDYIRNFALHVSHEFKTPLTSMHGTIELLQSYLGTMSEEKKNHFFNS